MHSREFVELLPHDDAEVLEAHPVDALVNGRDELDARDRSPVEEIERLGEHDQRDRAPVPDVLAIRTRMALEARPLVDVQIPVGDADGEVAESVGRDVDAAGRKTVALHRGERSIVPNDLGDGSDVGGILLDDLTTRTDGQTSPRDELVVVDPRLGRSPAEEILEGVLRHAVDAYEEKKVPFLGYLFAWAAFDQSYSAEELHLLLNLFDRVTYRGLSIVATVGQSGYQERLLDASMQRIRGSQSVQPSEQVVAELDALASSQLVGIRQEDGKVADIAGVYGGASFGSHDAKRAGLTPFGERFAVAFQLERVPDEDQRGTLWQLAGSNVPLGES